MLDLSGFTGTEKYTRWSNLFFRHYLTDGALYLAKNADAMWLMDAIASHHNNVMRSAARDERLKTMQVWFLRKKKSGCELSCWADTGEGERAVVTQKIEYTDFFSKYDGEELKLYCIQGEFSEGVRWVIMLPSEY